MTDRPESATGPSDARDERTSDARDDRRAATRRRAQRTRAQRRRRQRRTRLGLWAGLVVVLVAAATVVTLVLVTSVRPTGPGPRNMSQGGITIGTDLRSVRDPTPTPTPSGSAPTAQATASGDTVHIALYVDYLCPICGQFEKANTDYIRGLVQSGAATLEIHPVAILTNRSQGTRYSLRAANAAACVANSSPDQFFAVDAALFRNQPAEGSAGLDDARLTAIVAGTAGIRDVAAISRCIRDERYAAWVGEQTEAAQQHPLPGGTASLAGTPTVLVNGREYAYSVPFTNAEFRTFVVTAAGTGPTTGGPTRAPVPSATATPSAG